MPVYKAKFQPTDVNPPANFPAALRKMGPIIAVQIEVPQSLAEQIASVGNEIPQPQTGSALIDTGATISGVHSPVISGLGVQPVGTATLSTAGGEQQRSLYPIRIVLPQIRLTVDYNAVVDVDLAGDDYIALLGRDFLEKTLMIYDGKSGEITLAI